MKKARPRVEDPETRCFELEAWSNLDDPQTFIPQVEDAFYKIIDAAQKDVFWEKSIFRSYVDSEFHDWKYRRFV